MNSPPYVSIVGEGVAVPDVWFVDAVQDEVGKRDGVDEVFLFTAEEGGFFELVHLFGDG